MLNYIIIHVTYKLYTVISFSRQLSITIIHCTSYAIMYKGLKVLPLYIINAFFRSTRLHLVYKCAIMPFLLQSNADLDTGPSQKEQMAR